MNAWQIWIDTGGTFTDCLAIDPASRLSRFKILSSSILRGSVVRQLDARTMMVSLHWPGASDIYTGFRIRISRNFQSRIVSADPSTGVVVIEDPLPALSPPFWVQ